MFACWWASYSLFTQSLGCNSLEVLSWTQTLPSRDITTFDTSSRVFYVCSGINYLSFKKPRVNHFLSPDVPPERPGPILCWMGYQEDLVTRELTRGTRQQGCSSTLIRPVAATCPTSTLCPSSSSAPSSCWTCLWPSSWTTSTTSRGTPPSLGPTILESSSQHGRTLIQVECKSRHEGFYGHTIKVLSLSHFNVHLFLFQEHNPLYGGIGAAKEYWPSAGFREKVPR